MIPPEIVPPPVPAPYLKGVEQLPDELLIRIHAGTALPAAAERQASHAIRRAAKQIFLARSAYEAAHGVVIAPEPPPTE